VRLTGSVRRWLRAETRGEHDAVDAVYGALDLADATDFRRFLQAHARALLPLETALDEAGAARVLPDWPDRRRSAALLADLRALGETAPRPEPAPALNGEAAVWGAAYVLEGSRLGGRVLSRTAAASADPRVRAADRYLTHGQGGALWPVFLARLDASPAVRAQPEAALAAARLAFRAFRDALPAASPALAATI
jgi:heme oxygenase